ncbi:hypothetical protein TraAM80_06383 [Trypanosoma rangeli]|uniref:Uncharacterized protein n=1 Tax=Trypanosoma rangeli TaxID=5698 RepID=A0A422NAP2_TRYRA|nr:uncharacterized protein TraAM80_06383 [Trypanosoma rangeli]RNF02486.1 hypothetical protein TraAM80_06383 [Trypanosoma rangeli]|eukprot:RNF02486.1 hypothetical protein TraAM80_06383 [Trypanosoma rangeli]
MFAPGVTPRVSKPPVVRVPTLEPSASSSLPLFTGTRMLRGKLQERHMQGGGTLSDYYRSRHAGRDQQSPCHTDPLGELEGSANRVQIEELLRGIHETSTAAAAAVEELTANSPPPRQIRPSLQQRPCEVEQRRSASPDRPHMTRSSPMKRTPRGESPARPAWNQNRPTPRVKPTVSAPRTEPRRVTRGASVENRSRPWVEGIKRTPSSKEKRTAAKETDHSKGTPLTQSQPSRKLLSSARAAFSAGVTSPRTMFGEARGVSTGKGEAALQPRLGLLEKSLQDVHQRAVRAEARCEELEVTLQVLQMEHRDTLSRLEERNAQLNAQVQYVLQWVEHFGATRVAREVFAQEIGAGQATDGGGVEVPVTSLSTSKDGGGSSEMHTSVKSADSTGIEKALKATPIRVPPAPPMTLQLQHR